jgi:hypothetical protein
MVDRPLSRAGARLHLCRSCMKNSSHLIRRSGSLLLVLTRPTTRR